MRNNMSSYIQTRQNCNNSLNSSWNSSIIHRHFDAAEESSEGLEPSELFITKIAAPGRLPSLLTNSNQYLEFNNHLKNHSGNCVLDATMLETLNAIGTNPKPWAYTVIQASSPPRERIAEELLGFLDTESYSENTSNACVSLNPYLLICKLEGEMIAYDIINHGSAFIELFLRDLIENFSQANTNKEVYIIAHNFSGHDSILLINSFASLAGNANCICSVLYRSGKVYTFTIKWNNSVNVLMQIRFQCSLMLFQNSLEKLSTSFDKNIRNFPMPHKAVDSVNTLNTRDVSALLNHVNTIEENNSLLDMWVATNSKNIIDYANCYCRNDVELLEYVYTTFKSEYENAIIANNISNYDFITISRLAQTTWDSNINFNERVVSNIHNSTSLGKYLMAAYYGGKCEIYNGFLDKDTFCYYFDYPGMYSIAMQQPIPVGVPAYIDCNNVNCPQFFVMALHKAGLCAYLTVNFETPLNCSIPILPSNTSLSDGVPKLIFCNGSNHGTYYSYELEHAINSGYNIQNIFHGYVFNSYNTLKPYSTYITQLNHASNTNEDNVRTLMYKLLANSLYGNFGMQRQAQTFFTSNNISSLLTQVGQLYPINGSTSLASHRIQDVNTATNIAIAASVAAWGRIILSFGVETVLRNSPNSKLIYVDTDSIFFQSPTEITCNNMWNDLPWTTQGSYKNANFLASNLYLLTNFDGKLVLKINGVNPTSISSESFQNVSAATFNMLIENIELWTNTLPSGVTINLVNNTIAPYISPKRRLIHERGNWTGSTSPFSFESVNSRPLTSRAVLLRSSTNYTDFHPPNYVQISITRAGIEYSVGNVSLKPLPATNPSINNYTIDSYWNITDWPALYILIGLISNKLEANQLGIFFSEDHRPDQPLPPSDYVEYPAPFTSLGPEWLESYAKYQISNYLGRYAAPSRQSTNFSLLVQFILSNVFCPLNMAALVGQS